MRLRRMDSNLPTSRSAFHKWKEPGASPWENRAMRTVLFLLLFASVVSAQSQSVPCGSSSAAAAKAIPARRQFIRRGQGRSAAQIQRPVLPPPGRLPPASAVSLGARFTDRQSEFAGSLHSYRAAGHVSGSTMCCRRPSASHRTASSASQWGVGRRRTRRRDIVSSFPLKSDSLRHNFWYERPAPPQLSWSLRPGAEILRPPAPLGDGAASNLSAGTVAWEVCGYNAQ